jgi:hypothetical protein
MIPSKAALCHKLEFAHEVRKTEVKALREARAVFQRFVRARSSCAWGPSEKSGQLHECVNGAMFHPKKGQQMRKALLASVCLAALSAPALAREVYCSGHPFGMQVRVVVTLDINDEKLPACEIPLTSKARSRLDQFCNDGHCTFSGHVERQIGNLYIIDRIVGPVKEERLLRSPPLPLANAGRQRCARWRSDPYPDCASFGRRSTPNAARVF